VNFRNDIDPLIVQKLKNEEKRIGHRVFRTEHRNRLDELLQMKKQESHMITKQFLSKLKQNQQIPFMKMEAQLSQIGFTRTFNKTVD
jgi:hypothetical protein